MRIRHSALFCNRLSFKSLVVQIPYPLTLRQFPVLTVTQDDELGQEFRRRQNHVRLSWIKTIHVGLYKRNSRPIRKTNAEYQVKVKLEWVWPGWIMQVMKVVTSSYLRVSQAEMCLKNMRTCWWLIVWLVILWWSPTILWTNSVPTFRPTDFEPSWSKLTLKTRQRTNSEKRCFSNQRKRNLGYRDIQVFNRDIWKSRCHRKSWTRTRHAPPMQKRHERKLLVWIDGSLIHYFILFGKKITHHSACLHPGLWNM